MNTIVTADLHLNDNPRDAYRHAFMQALPDMLRLNKASCLMILGDLTDEKDHHGAWLVNQIAKHVHECAKVCPIIINRGNHDYIVEQQPFFGFVNRIANVYWINIATDTQDFRLPIEQLGRCLLLPHTNDYKRDWASFKFDQYSYIFAHNTFNGAAVGFGRKLEGIDTDIFPSKARVVSGDIHVPQRLGPVRYVGAPYTIDFGDAYDGRLLLLQRVKIKSILVDGPQKRLITITDTTRKPDVSSLNKGDILKIQVRLTAARMKEWPQIKHTWQDWGHKAGYVVHMVIPEVTDSTRSIIINKPRNNKSDAELLREYAGARKIDKSTINTGLKLLEQV